MPEGEGNGAVAAPAESADSGGGNDLGIISQKSSEESGASEFRNMPQQGVEDGQKILGRFDSQEDLIEDWKAKNDLVRGRAEGLTDDALLEQLDARGLHESAPDQYDFGAADGSFGYELADRAENAEAYAAFEDPLREAGVSQAQLDAIIPLVEQVNQASLAAHGVGVDHAAEKAALQEAWGADYERFGRATAQWAEANVPRGVWSFLRQTAEGMQFARQAFLAQRGGQPMVPNRAETRGSAAPADLEGRLREMRQQDAYRDSFNPNHAAVHAEYDRLRAELSKIQQAG